MNVVKNHFICPGRSESINFLQQLLTYLKSGHILQESLQLCTQVLGETQQYVFVSRISRLVTHGNSWSSSIRSVFARHSGLYSLAWAKNHSSLVKTAEHILQTMQRQERLIHSLTSTMLYPIIVLAGLIGTVVAYQIIIAPQFHAYLPEKTVWFGSVPPVIIGSILLSALLGTSYVLVNPFQPGFAQLLKKLPGIKWLIKLRIWELLLVFLDVRISSGFTLWEAISSARKIYGSTEETHQLGRIQQALFENRNMQHTVLHNPHIPDCLRKLLYSSLSCNNLESSLPSMGQIISWQIDQSIIRLTALTGPISILLCGWAVLGLCMDILLPLHRFLSGGIL